MTEQLHFSELWPHWPELLAGLWVTVQLTVLATIGGLAIGILGAAIRSGRPGALSRVWGGYVEIIRNTPFVVQLFLSSLVYRTRTEDDRRRSGAAGDGGEPWGLQHRDRARRHSGDAERPVGGRTRARTQPDANLRSRRAAPALQRIYPALVSQCIIVMLGSSVVSQVSYEELTFAANLIQSRTFLSFEVYLVTTGIYLALSIAMRQLLMAAGRKWLGVQA